MKCESVALLLLAVIMNLVQQGATEPSAIDSIFLPPELDPFRDEYLETITQLSIEDLHQLPKLDDAQLLDRLAQGVYSVPANLARSQTANALANPVLDEDLEYYPDRETEWEQMMVGGPLSINYMSSVMAIASKKDFSFKSDFNFTLIKYPKSFRTTLVQVVNDMYNALFGAHTGMDRIQLNMRQIPSLLKTALMLITQASPTMIKAMLPRTLTNIELYANSSAATAEATLNRFSSLEDLLQEVSVATTDTNSGNMNALEKLKAEAAAIKETQKMMETILSNLTSEEDRARQDLEKARQDYHKAILNVPGGKWDVSAWQVYASNRPTALCSRWWFWRRCVNERDEQKFQQYTQEAKDKAEKALESLRKAEERSKELFNEQMNKQNEMMISINGLANLNFTTMSTGETVKVLLDTTAQIAKIQEQWSRITRFFSKLSGLVGHTRRVIMNEFLGVITDAQKLGQDVSSMDQTWFQVTLVATATEIDRDAHQLFIMSKTYLDVSEKYMVGQVAGLTGYSALQTDAERDSHVRAMAQAARVISNSVKKLATERKTAYELASFSRQEEYEQFIEQVTMVESIDFLGNIGIGKRR